MLDTTMSLCGGEPMYKVITKQFHDSRDESDSKSMTAGVISAKVNYSPLCDD